jgi:hypothetical protein
VYVFPVVPDITSKYTSASHLLRSTFIEDSLQTCQTSVMEQQTRCTGQWLAVLAAMLVMLSLYVTPWTKLVLGLVPCLFLDPVAGHLSCNNKPT